MRAGLSEIQKSHVIFVHEEFNGERNEKHPLSGGSVGVNALSGGTLEENNGRGNPVITLYT